jgi:hypothetical protein
VVREFVGQDGLFRLLAVESRFSDRVLLFDEESANGLRFG